MGGIGVISNPMSGRNRRNPGLARRLGYILGDGGELAQPGSFADLDATARSFRDRGVELVCVHGGDGTLHKTLSALFGAYRTTHEGPLGELVLPRIAILKGGTMNTLARNVGVRRRAEAMLGHVVSGHHAGVPFEVVERRMLVVDDHHCGFLFGTGVLARFLEAYYAGGDPSPRKAVSTLLRAIWGGLFGTEFGTWLMKPDPFRVRVDGRRWEAEAFAAVAAGTMADLGLGFRVFHLCLRHPEHFHAVASTAGAVPIIGALPRIYMARDYAREGVECEVGRVLEIDHDGPIGFMIDGDFVQGGQSVRVEVGPRVRFVVG